MDSVAGLVIVVLSKAGQMGTDALPCVAPTTALLPRSLNTPPAEYGVQPALFQCTAAMADEPRVSDYSAARTQPIAIQSKPAAALD